MEQHVLRLLTINSASLPIGTHAALAQLMRVLKQRPRTRTNRPSQQLILTTNYDLNMERALLRAGLPFSRLVHHRAGSRIDVGKIVNVSLGLNNTIIVDGNSVDTRDSAQLDDVLDRCEHHTIRLTDGTAMHSGSDNPLASLVVTDLPDPLLYKFHGSQDINNSSTISTDQSFEFVWHLLRQRCIPSQISEIIGNSTLIVLGSTLLDYDFRVTYHTLLREPLASGFSNRYAIIGRSELDQRDYAHKLTEQAWERVKNAALTKYRVELLDAPVVPILTRVTERLRSAWGVT